ncbi:hypothetical protein Q5752_004913 [Cryptotrichosporon argae]
MAAASSRIRTRVLALITVSALAILLIGPPIHLTAPSFTFRSSNPACPTLPGKRVAIVEQTRYHDGESLYSYPAHADVIGTVAEVMTNLNTNFTLYRNELNDGFEQVLASPPRRPLNDLVAELTANALDVVVLVTCDAKFWVGRGAIIDAIHNSAASVLCIVHEVERWNYNGADALQLAPLAEEGRLGVLTLSQHSARAARRRLWLMARERREGFWEQVEVGWYAPIFTLSTDVVPKEPTRDPLVSRAAVLGRVHQSSRDYAGLFADLEAAIVAEPALWGYALVDGQLVALEPDAAFQLHLIGKYQPEQSALTIPPLLNGTAVILRSELEYVELYRAIRDMDVILPAFQGTNYLDARTSAAVPVAMIAKTPILAHPHLLDGYAYLAPPAYLFSSAATPEVASIAHFRREALRNASPALSAVTWEEYHARLHEENKCVWTAVLRAASGEDRVGGITGVSMDIPRWYL